MVSNKILIASKRIFNDVERHLEIQVMTNRSLTEMSKNHSHYGITRQVKDLTSVLENDLDVSQEKSKL